VLAASRFLLPLGLFLSLALVPQRAAAVNEPRLRAHDFTGVQSCQTSGCHGGGAGNNQTIIWEKKDAHAKGAAILRVARSKSIAEGAGIADATRDARCTVCHSPLESVPPDRIAPGVNVEQGVSCEACHGPAEPWLRFHTRQDISRDHRLASGMREMRPLYERANTCVACHLYIEPDLAKAGHPEMFFELARQNQNMPPHWREIEDEWLAPRMWLVGQAVSLRELSWRLGQRSDEDIAARVEGLRWLLGLSVVGGGGQLSGGDPRSAQSAADRLAKNASTTKWTREQTLGQLRKFAESNTDFRNAKGSAKEMLRRAQVLVPAIELYWNVLKAKGVASPTFDQALGVVQNELKKGTAFEAPLFAAALQQLEVAMVQMK
jgi:hypothetical protein